VDNNYLEGSFPAKMIICFQFPIPLCDCVLFVCLFLDLPGKAGFSKRERGENMKRQGKRKKDKKRATYPSGRKI
jgi:hypothetical protein